MASLIDYPNVLARLTSQGLHSLYHNAGAFGFATGMATRTLAWIGPDDPTIRDAAKSFVRTVQPPFESTLAALFRRAWIEQLPGPIWIMPMSHWHYELQFGNAAWLPDALAAVNVAGALLRERNDGSAPEFEMGDWPPLESFVEGV